MKKLMVALLLLVAVSNIAAAQEHFIGMFVDEQAVVCHGPLDAYVPASIYLFALVGPEVGLLSAAEFRVEGLPEGADWIITPAWNTDLVIGDLGYGIALAFSPFLPGPTCFLGSVQFLILNADVPQDLELQVMASNDSGALLVVNELFEELEARGGIYTFNCASGDCDCEPGVATEEATISSIKALY